MLNTADAAEIGKEAYNRTGNQKEKEYKGEAGHKLGNREVCGVIIGYYYFERGIHLIHPRFHLGIGKEICNKGN